MRRNSKGFTLVEIIVVLLIIAIIAAISLPALTGYIEDSKQKSALQECKTVITAAQSIASELHAYGVTPENICRYLDSNKKGTTAGAVPASYNKTVGSLTGIVFTTGQGIQQVLLDADNHVGFVIMTASNNLQVCYRSDEGFVFGDDVPQIGPSSKGNG